jgi:hypothetical protein
MEEYGLYIAFICLFLAAYVLVKGIAAAYRQGHGDGSVSLFPPPAYGVVASVLLTLGLGFFRLTLPWWGFRIIFPGTTLLFPAILYIIGRRPPQGHTHPFPKGQ